jgi:hypothetical protein
MQHSPEQLFMLLTFYISALFILLKNLKLDTVKGFVINQYDLSIGDTLPCSAALP